MKVLFWTLLVVVTGLGYLLYNDYTTPTSEETAQSKELPFSAEISGPTVTLETPAIEHLAPHVHQAHNTVHDHGHHVTVRSNILLAQEDMWVTGFKFTIDNAPVSTLHHAQLSDLNALSNTCATTSQPKELLTIGEDTLGSNSIIFDEPQGLFIPAGHRLQMLSMFHNPEPPIGVGGDFYDVRARLELAYEPARESSRSVALEHYHLHLEDEICTGMYTFAVPAETTDFTREPIGTSSIDPAVVEFDQAGEIVYLGGHLHGWEGGKYLELLRNGEPIRRLETNRSDQADMQWETPHGPDSIPVEPGDTISISAVYDNPQSEAIVGAMGIVNFYFAPDTQVTTDD